MRPADMIFSCPPLPEEYKDWVRTTKNVGAVAYDMDTNRLRVLTYCPITEEGFHVMELPFHLAMPLARWLDGEGLIQQMLPELSIEEREQLISGLLPHEFPKEE